MSAPSLEADNLKLKTEAEAVKAKMDGESVIIIRQSSETGQLYGSVNTRDIATSYTEAGFSLNKSQIILDAPIKELGIYDISVSLHPEVEANVKINVARTEEEAELQARGESVTIEAEEEETVEIEEVFEEGVEVSLDDEAQAEETVEAAPEETTEVASDEEASEEASRRNGSLGADIYRKAKVFPIIHKLSNIKIRELVFLGA